jgi:hypothetical protein
MLLCNSFTVVIPIARREMAIVPVTLRTDMSIPFKNARLACETMKLIVLIGLLKIGPRTTACP